MRNEWSTIDSIKGVSPDWEILPLQEFSSPEKNSFVNGPFGSDLLSSELVLAGQPVIYIRDIRNGRYLRKSEVFVTNEKYQTLTACQVNYGDVIVAKVGDPPCESAVYDAHESGIVTQDVIRIRTEELRCSQFIVFILNSDIGKRQVKRIKISGTRDRVSLTDFKKIKFPHPPVSEQRKIAKILSTWDKAITTIEQLLANSQLQKKALMQQLLTGKKRLLDKNGVRFSGEWDSKLLGSLIELLSGFAFKSSEFEKGAEYKLLRGINISQGFLRWADDQTYSWSDSDAYRRYKLEKDDIVISMDGSLVGRNYAMITEENLEPMLLVQRVARLRCLKDLSPDFLLQHIASDRFKSYVDAVKTITAIPHISAKDIRDFPISVPPHAEQQKIAAVLSNVDQEISTLQQKLDALRQEKKALMQQLLTGKRRVQIN